MNSPKHAWCTGYIGGIFWLFFLRLGISSFSRYLYGFVHVTASWVTYSRRFRSRFSANRQISTRTTTGSQYPVGLSHAILAALLSILSWQTPDRGRNADSAAFPQLGLNHVIAMSHAYSPYSHMHPDTPHCRQVIILSRPRNTGPRNKIKLSSSPFG